MKKILLISTVILVALMNMYSFVGTEGSISNLNNLMKQNVASAEGDQPWSCYLTEVSEEGEMCFDDRYWDCQGWAETTTTVVINCENNNRGSFNSDISCNTTFTYTCKCETEFNYFDDGHWCYDSAYEIGYTFD